MQFYGVCLFITQELNDDLFMSMWEEWNKILLIRTESDKQQ